MHHIVFRSQGGSDDLDNLITLCEKCHRGLHKGEIKLKTKRKKKSVLKHATQMSTIRCMLLRHYPEAIETFGYVTKANREQSELNKEHYNDAITIACGYTPKPKMLSYLYIKKHVSKGDYQLCKGARGEVKIPTGKICGFRKFDKVRYCGLDLFIKGRMTKSKQAILMDVNGATVDCRSCGGNKVPNMKRLTKIQARNGVLCTKKIITTEADTISTD